MFGFIDRSNAQNITNITATQNGKNIIVNYNLNGKEGISSYEIKLYVSPDGGNTWQGPLTAVSGAVGKAQTAGTEKSITWEVLNEKGFNKLKGRDIRFKVIAILSKNIIKETKTVDEIKPIDKTDIPSVLIGNQVWMTKNLDVDHYQNGDIIDEVTSAGDWYRVGLKQIGAWCYFNNEPANGARYGKLYNWYAVNDKRGLCPKGWHVPSAAEWTELIEQLGGMKSAYKKLKSTKDWINEKGNNKSGFNALPGSTRSYDGKFPVRLIDTYGIGNEGKWWSSNSYNENDAIFFEIHDFYSDELPYLNSLSKHNGYSIRCIKN